MKIVRLWLFLSLIVITTFSLLGKVTANNKYNIVKFLQVTCTSLTISPPALPNATLGVSYSQTLTASGGTAPYTFSVTTGTLPPGITLDSAGNITGNPTTTGSFGFTVQAIDSAMCTGTQNYTLLVNSGNCSPITITPSTIPSGSLGVAYNQTLGATGGVAPYSFSLISGTTLPPGLTLSSNGTISGTPTVNGTFLFYVQVSDTIGCLDSRAYAIVILCPTIAISPATLPPVAIGTAYRQTLTASGGVSPYSFSILSGSLPSGITLNSSGAFSGSPTTAGLFSFTVQVVDNVMCTSTKTYTLTVTTSCSNVVLSPSTLPSGVVGAGYSQAVTLAGGSPSIDVGVLSGSLPPGLRVVVMGTRIRTGITLVGTPTAPGIYTFTLQGVDSAGCSDTRNYTIVISSVNCLDISIAPTSLPSGRVNTPYNAALSASPSASYTYSLASGLLPPGLILSNNGLISGTPTTTGTFSFVVQAIDTNFCIGTNNYTIIIAGTSGTIGFSVGTFSTVEGGVATITVTRTNGGSGQVSVDYLTNNGTAIAGKDYVGTSGTITFASGDTAPKTFTIQTIANNVFEPNKTFNISLNNVTGGASLGIVSATLTITEKDTPRPGKLAFSQSAYTVNETSGIATITVTRSDGGNLPVSVNFSTSAGTNAQAGFNYIDVNGTLNFPTGSTSQSFNIPIINDNKPGQDKVVNLLLNGATNGATIAGGTAILNILESTASLPPAVLQTDTKIDFGSVNIGDMTKRTVTIRNTGGQDLLFDTPKITGDGISITTPPSTTRITPNQSTTFEIALKPAPGSLGDVTGSIIINSNGGSANIKLSGQSIDTILPKVSFISPAGGELFTAGSSVRIRYDAMDNDGLNDFAVSFLATQNSLTSTNTESAATMVIGGDIARLDSTNRDVIWNIPADLETSNARITIKARDRAGNIMTLGSGQFSIQRPMMSSPILQTNVSFTPTPDGQFTPPTNLTVNATEVRNNMVIQPPAPILLVNITFQPPPQNQLLPPQNVMVKAGELTNPGISKVYKISTKIGSNADGDLVLAGYVVYRALQNDDGTIPTSDQIVKPENMVTTLPPNATGFVDKVSTSGGNNYVYSVTSFFGNGMMSSGSQPMGTNLPVIKNPMFIKGTIFLDSPNSFIKPGAMLIVNDRETYILQFDDSGTRFTIPKKQLSTGSSLIIKRVITKNSTVKLLIKNPEGTTSVGVMFSRTGAIKGLNTNNLADQQSKENSLTTQESKENISPLVDATLTGYNIYRVVAPADGSIPLPSQIIQPENLVGSIPANMNTFTDKVSSGQSSSGNFVYSVTSFFGNGMMSSGSQPASTNLPVIKNPRFEDKTFFLDSPNSFIKPGAILIINDTEMYSLDFDNSGTRFTPGKKTGSTSGQTIDKFIQKDSTVRLTVKNPDGKLSVGVMFTRN